MKSIRLKTEYNIASSKANRCIDDLVESKYLTYRIFVSLNWAYNTALETIFSSAIGEGIRSKTS